jgi:hypothetical protein
MEHWPNQGRRFDRRTRAELFAVDAEHERSCSLPRPLESEDPENAAEHRDPGPHGRSDSPLGVAACPQARTQSTKTRDAARIGHSTERSPADFYETGDGRRKLVLKAIVPSHAPIPFLPA